MNVKVTWLQGKSFEGTGKEGTTISMDVPIDKGGNGLGPTPKEVYMMSVAGCSGVDVVSILQKKRMEIVSFEIEVNAVEQTEKHPYVYTKAKIHYKLKGKNLTDAAVKQAIILSQDKYCGISAMMRKAFEIRHTYEFENVGE